MSNNLFIKILKIFFTKQIFGTILVVIFATILINIINKLISKILIKGKSTFEIKKRTSIVKLFKSIITTSIILIAILIILDFFGVDTRSLITSLGIVGLVLGLALQDTARDFIGGISLILENYLQVGDVVTYNNFTGEVTSIGLRTTKIRAFSGEVMIIANRNIDTIINVSQEKSHWYLEIDTAYEEDNLKVAKVLQDVVKKAIEDGLIYKDSAYLGINALSSSSVRYILDIHCNQDDRYKIKRAILERIKVAYDQNNIKIPYNQIEVHNGKKL